jgi:hypothetical protein
MGLTQVYSASEHTFSFGGISIDQGAQGGDDFLTCTKISETFTLREGIGGGTTRVYNPSKAWSVKAKIRQTDPVNTTLMALHLLDQKTAGGVGMVPAYIADRLGNSKMVDTQAFIVKAPDLKAAKDESDNEWEFIFPTAEVFIGGH